jgi:hypothetical protein
MTIGLMTEEGPRLELTDLDGARELPTAGHSERTLRGGAAATLEEGMFSRRMPDDPSLGQRIHRRISSGSGGEE